jgi:hypothetical protein
MGERFEVDVEAMFAQAPSLPDREAFALSVDRALHRRWLARRAALAAAGVAGLAVALSRLDGLRDLDIAMPDFVPAGLQSLALTTPYGMLGLWMAAGLVAAAAVVARNVEV